ncbi:hypothetical protein D5F01_LYC23143 [Larimichthys crocea]|uniref:Uncharacterized protein n=1 Tax=Larimichthys crocea TaxID=215358 RepID=A0A6G0HGC0_LARCR|nr:hypothetical protein D5F01_LYC23143 [Larimichthys crocea]
MHGLKRFILILRGFLGWMVEKMQGDRPEHPQTGANPCRQLHSPCSANANKSEVEEVGGLGSPSAGSGRADRGEIKGQAPASCFSPSVLLSDKRAPSSNTNATPTTSLPRGSCQRGGRTGPASMHLADRRLGREVEEREEGVLINCLCTYSQQPGPRLTRWKIRYDSFPEKGQKKKSELPLRRGIPGTSKRP